MNPKESKPGSGLPVTVKKELLPSLATSGTSKDAAARALGSGRLGSTSRLPSFRGPRDLTLSALATSTNIQTQIARPKKIFVPNIPVRREKGEKVVESKSEKSSRGSNKNRQDRGRGRGRGREREFVQTRGTLFGEGIASAPLKRTGGSSYGGYDGGKGGGGSKIGEMQKPVLNTEAAYNIDKDLEDKRLKEILRDDFIDDPDEVTPLDSLPIQLPMITRLDLALKGEMDETKIKDKWKRRYSRDEAESKPSTSPPKTGIKIKQEPGEEETDELADGKINGLIDTGGGAVMDQSAGTGEGSVAHLLSQPQSDVMFFHLPSCLPGHPPEVKLEPNTSASSSQNQATKNPNSGSGSSCDREPLCTLDTLPEGRIGSLKIYESGKVEMCLGNHNLEINRGTPVGFLQDLVRIDVDNEQKEGTMVVLGHVTERLVCTPDFQSLSLKGNKS